MQRVKYLLLALGLLAVPMFIWATIVHAQSFRSSSAITIPSGQTVNDTLFIAGRTVDVAGNVNGDLFCAGNNITVSGRVRGDVICAGQNITVSGQVTGNVRLAGQNVTLEGQVGGNATVGAMSFTQQQKSVVLGDMTVGSTDATVNGRVGRDVAASSTTLTLGGTVGRNVQASVVHLNLDNGAKVAGDVTYASANKLGKEQGAQVGGAVTQNPPISHTHTGWPHINVWLIALYLYLSFIIVAIVLALLLPGLFERGIIVARGHLGTTFLTGLISSIVVPIVLSLLAATIIGIPLALLAVLIWIVMLILASPFAAYMLGKRILSDRRNAVLIILVGSAILFLLYLIPFLGELVWLVATWFGLGVILRLARGIGRPYHDASTDTPPPTSTPVSTKTA